MKKMSFSGQSIFRSLNSDDVQTVPQMNPNPNSGSFQRSEEDSSPNRDDMSQTMSEERGSTNLLTASDLGYKWQIGCDTDIGGSRENQDDCFYYVPDSGEGFVCGVLDGHGREVLFIFSFFGF